MKDGHGDRQRDPGGVETFLAKLPNGQPKSRPALRKKQCRPRFAREFLLRNINVGQVKHALITIDFNYEEGAKGKYTPVMRGFYVDNMKSARALGVDIQGLDAGRSRTFPSKTAPRQCRKWHVVKSQGQTLDNVKVNGRPSIASNRS
jgi:hypothetical protein